MIEIFFINNPYWWIQFIFFHYWMVFELSIHEKKEESEKEGNQIKTGRQGGRILRTIPLQYSEEKDQVWCQYSHFWEQSHPTSEMREGEINNPNGLGEERVCFPPNWEDFSWGFPSLAFTMSFPQKWLLSPISGGMKSMNGWVFPPCVQEKCLGLWLSSSLKGIRFIDYLEEVLSKNCLFIASFILIFVGKPLEAFVITFMMEKERLMLMILSCFFFHSWKPINLIWGMMLFFINPL